MYVKGIGCVHVWAPRVGMLMTHAQSVSVGMSEQ